MEYKKGDYIIAKQYIYPAKIISINEKGIIIMLPRFALYNNNDFVMYDSYDNDHVVFYRCEIKSSDIVDFSTKDAFVQAAKDSLIEYQNTVNRRLTKMQNLIILSEVFK